MQLFDETAQDLAAIEALYDRCFQPNRQALSSYRLREGVAPIAALCRLVRDSQGVLRGAVRFWPVRVGEQPALLLGPIAVDPDCQGQGYGEALITDGYARARALGHSRILLVGDLDYFGRFGFVQLADVVMPPPTDPARVLGYELQPGAWAGLSGAVQSIA